MNIKHHIKEIIKPFYHILVIYFYKKLILRRYFIIFTKYNIQ